MQDGAWIRALDEWMVLAKRAAHDASVEAAQAIGDEAQSLLTELEHDPHTKTPASRGMPPASISGRLAASITVGTYNGMVAVGPTTAASSKNGAYGRIQELGGPSSGHPMTWLEDGHWWSMYYRVLPSRPYLKPATEFMIDTGTVTRFYYDAWLRAQVEATS